MDKNFDQIQLIDMIKCLLDAPAGWSFEGSSSREDIQAGQYPDEFCTLHIKAHGPAVKKAVYDWLSVPERKESFEDIVEVKRTLTYRGSKKWIRETLQNRVVQGRYNLNPYCSIIEEEISEEDLDVLK